jgi:dipeptidyl aminopeptidase/acylaminoacyl peptidase
MLARALILNQAGYSTLLFDFYGQGESDGDAVTLGFNERQDAVAAVEYLKTRDDVDDANLGILGISMGGSVAIMAAAMSPDIKAVVADSPFQSASRGIEEGFTRVTGLPRFPFSPIVLRFIRWRLGISPDEIVPIDQVAAISPRPLLLIHGTADADVSPGNSEALFAAAGEPKELVLLPGIEHASGMKDVPDDYTELIVGFFDRYLD